jgi:uncharacterized protein (TIGR03435 family)
LTDRKDTARRNPFGGRNVTLEMLATSISAKTGGTFREALKNQLGLKLEPAKGPVQVLVIDHVEQPTVN